MMKPAISKKIEDDGTSSASKRAQNYSSSDSSVEDWRNEFLPDRSKGDFYCDVCCAHMNSEQMWENHVQGKRHIKNIKKAPGELPSKVRSVSCSSQNPKLLRALNDVTSPIVGLNYTCELQRSEPNLGPIYSCFLCHATCTSSSIIDHLLGCKHRLNYMKEVSPDDFVLVEKMDLKKEAKASIVEEYAQSLEAQKGRGKIEVKLEKPKMMPPLPRREKRYYKHEVEDDFYSKRRNIRSHGDWKREYERDTRSSERTFLTMKRRTSPPVVPVIQIPCITSIVSDVRGWSMPEKLALLDQMASITLASDNEANSLMKIINNMTQCLLQFKIRNLPPGTQDMLAKYIIGGDTRSLERALGLEGSGVTDVGQVLTSMATADIGNGWGLQSLQPSPGIYMDSIENMHEVNHSHAISSPLRDPRLYRRK